MNLIELFVVLVIILLTTACSSVVSNLPSNDELLREFTEQDGRACVRERDINGFGVLDSDVISVDSRAKNNYYLMTTMYKCHSLNISPNLAFLGDFGEFCGGGKDKINTGDESCPIKSIYKFQTREQAFAAFDIVLDKRDQLRKQ